MYILLLQAGDRWLVSCLDRCFLSVLIIHKQGTFNFCVLTETPIHSLACSSPSSLQVHVRSGPDDSEAASDSDAAEKQPAGAAAAAAGTWHKHKFEVRRLLQGCHRGLPAPPLCALYTQSHALSARLLHPVTCSFRCFSAPVLVAACMEMGWCQHAWRWAQLTLLWVRRVQLQGPPLPVGYTVAHRPCA